MITYIKGTIAEKSENHIVIEAGGIGYMAYMATSSIYDIGPIGEKIHLLIHMIVKEDGITFYGFTSKEEKALFGKLISVGGIGPKGAIAILSSGRIEEIVSDIATGNLMGLSTVKGIGKKTAERIIVELRDKVSKLSPIELSAGTSTAFSNEGVVALQSLGFSKKEAEDMVKFAMSKNATSLEEIIKIALKKSVR